MQDHLEGLNNKQKEAATHVSGPLLIVAGAGAGKTKTITHRILNLIKEGVAPENILAVTFTNKAAKEMRERINYELQINNYELNEAMPFISTFHSLGVHIIKENVRTLGLTRHFSILDENDTNSLLKEIMKNMNLDIKQYDPRKIGNIISREKGKFVTVENFSEKFNSETLGGSDFLNKLVAEVWLEYEKRKNKENSLDFDDLLLKTVKLLKDNEEIRKKYQNQWHYLHIDEYQDTNEVQYLMAHLLSSERKNICVVGDADQNIYSWRGANLKNILNFEKDFPNTKIVLLEENYRSTQNILEAANEIIKKNKYRPEKNLFTKNPAGEKIGFYEALDENDEADFVATKILEIMDNCSENSSFFGSLSDPVGSALPLDPSICETPKNRKFSEDKRQNVFEGTLGRSDGDGQRKFSAENFRGESENILPETAILYRANFQSRVLEEAMLRYNIPYQVLGVKFFERKEIKDTLAYLRAALNKENFSDIKRIINFPARGIGKATLAKILAGQIETLPIKTKIKIQNFYKLLEQIKEKIETEKISDVIKFTVKKTGIEDELSSGSEEDLERLENIKELATLALKYDNLPTGQAGLKNGEGVEKLLEDAALASEQDEINLKVEKDNKNKVRLMTVHAAKGLEFKYVFVVGLENGLFPHQRQNLKNEDAEEERRLFYVALTRAKEKLFLSFANFRTIFGSRQINAPSEFISDIPTDLLEREGEKDRIKTIYI